MEDQNTSEHGLSRLYLDLLQRVLLREGLGPEMRQLRPGRGVKRLLYAPFEWALHRCDLQLVRLVPEDIATEGRGWKADAETMVGRRRLENLEQCITDVLARGVPGDLIETGVWRGGASIFMRAVLKAYGDTQRVVWAADSFEGLPSPDPETFSVDTGDEHWKAVQLAVPLEQVRQNFAQYGLLDDQVQFLVGWFRDTLAAAPIGTLSVLRLDGDMYESTMVALTSLYDKLSVGGYVIVDDYGAVEGCKLAVDEFRAERGISEELNHIDWTGVYWQRLR